LGVLGVALGLAIASPRWRIIATVIALAAGVCAVARILLLRR
jgi:hypothetical protein